jgi:prophage maintenance system killer protein
MFCVLNGYMLEVTTDAAVDLMLAIAAGDLDEPPWLRG